MASQPKHNLAPVDRARRSQTITEHRAKMDALLQSFDSIPSLMKQMDSDSLSVVTSGIHIRAMKLACKSAVIQVGWLAKRAEWKTNYHCYRLPFLSMKAPKSEKSRAKVCNIWCVYFCCVLAFLIMCGHFSAAHNQLRSLDETGKMYEKYDTNRQA
jgi:hypothetical protein